MKKKQKTLYIDKIEIPVSLEKDTKLHDYLRISHERIITKIHTAENMRMKDTQRECISINSTKSLFLMFSAVKKRCEASSHNTKNVITPLKH
jgi:hypothetical protein